MMFGLGALAFATPWALLALAALPALYFLLRLTPPNPKRVSFPAIALLRDLIVRQETPARTPWWLVLLRMALAALLILAAAQPLLNPTPAPAAGGPLLLVVDNGWGAAVDWPARQRAMAESIGAAERSGRPVVLLATAPGDDGAAPAAQGPMDAGAARRLAERLQPQPWPVDRAGALKAVQGLQLTGAATGLWLADGLGDAAVDPLARALQQLGPLTVRTTPPEQAAMALPPPRNDGTAMTAGLLRVPVGAPATVTLRAAAADGRTLARLPLRFEAGAGAAEGRLELPLELRNEIVRLDIDAQATAGSVALLDGRWRRRAVGIAGGRPQSEAQPLLAETFYLERALAPFAEIRRGDAATLADGKPSAILLPDGGLSPAELERLANWVQAGGVLVRFAGPLLAENPDDLLPVRLRAGDRTLGGALSWSQPAALAPFAPDSPFFGASLPPDIRVNRQVLAEPTLDLADKTWARLADGTPLVTAAKRGEGFVVLFHTTGNADWSNLPLSGLFPDMLRRLASLGEGEAARQGASLPPLELLDAFGRLGAPGAGAVPLPAEAEAVSPRHPPGFYGTPEARRALNLGGSVVPAAFGPLPPGVAVADYAGAAGEVPLAPWLLAAAVLLLALDVLATLLLSGQLRRAASAAAAVALLAMLPLAGPRAQDAAPPDWALEDAMRLAYVVTGDGEVDRTTEAGMRGLADTLSRRTTVEEVEAQAVDIETDELAFFPFLYWPVTPAQAPPSPAAVARLNAYLRNGGTIVFDTRDGNDGAVNPDLARLAEGLDMPPLAPVPPDHVLTKAFYLLQDFPGRWDGGGPWVEARETPVNDGVSPVIVAVNDYAAAWALGPNGQPLYATVPGGERQRELATRFGVNLVMYVLTGNYKADQVHVPAILERLGQ
ncbi:MAG TPA: DUF4159 domain-containing protein [Alphaproteobacteria bacterium]|nr:DUF4159 domain-containing protein [Alphaproteobacteria bacterium]